MSQQKQEGNRTTGARKTCLDFSLEHFVSPRRFPNLQKKMATSSMYTSCTCATFLYPDRCLPVCPPTLSTTLGKLPVLQFNAGMNLHEIGMNKHNAFRFTQKEIMSIMSRETGAQCQKIVASGSLPIHSTSPRFLW